MNIISDEKFELAWDLAVKEFSVRDIAKIAKIAKQTAHNICFGVQQMRADEGKLIPEKKKEGYWSQKKRLWGCRHNKFGKAMGITNHGRGRDEKLSKLLYGLNGKAGTSIGKT